jgi:hypothetical protein
MVFNHRQTPKPHIAPVAIGIILTIGSTGLRAGGEANQAPAPSEDHIASVIPESFNGNRILWIGSTNTGRQKTLSAVAVEGEDRLAAAPRNLIRKPYEGHIEGLDAWWQAAFDRENLYVFVRANMPGAKFRQPRGGDEYGGDLFELFIDPTVSGKHKYQFCANPIGLRYDSYQNQKTWDADWTAKGAADEKGWQVLYTIPLESFGENLKSGTRTIGINVGVYGSGQHVSWTGHWGDPGSYSSLVLGRIAKPARRSLGVKLRLDRKVYDSLDLTAQALVSIDGEVPDHSVLTLSLDSDGTQVSSHQVPMDQISGTGLAFVIDLRDLNPGRHLLRVRFVREEDELGGATVPFEVVPLVPGAVRPKLAGRIPILVQPDMAAATLGEQPVTTGVPLPRGTALSAEHFKLLAPDGRTEVPLQARVSARWSPRGYAKWLLLDFPAHVDSEHVTSYSLQYGPGVQRMPVSSPLKITQENGLISVDTGPLKFSVRKRGFSFLESASLNGKKLVRGSRITLTDEHGTVYDASADVDSEVTIEEAGPLRAVIAAKGWFVADSKRVGQYVVRICAWRGEPYLRVFHTFVVTEPTKTLRYRNIALESRLTDAGRAVFGIEGQDAVRATGSNAWLVQESYDRLRVAEKSGDLEKTLATGERSAGWVRSGSVSVAVRDMWQNFPKELEVENDTLRVHFWPRHPGPVRHPTKAVTARDIHMLWFAHEGELLDFSIPDDYARFHNVDDAKTHEFYYIPNVLKDNSDEALGIARTHEMIWLFGAGEDDTGSRLAALTQDIGCLPAPEWIDDSRAVGMLHPVDRERFPDVETALSRHFDWLQRSTEFMHDYGMWNFGDRHSRWSPGERRVPVNRTWANHHHGNPRTSWLLYLRSGDTKYLTAARRQALHLMDVDICHYSTPEYEARGYPVGKIPGALCDYKGLVHWHSGNRLYDYNNLSDYLFYDYYLTGYRRAVDVACETADAVARFPRGGNSGRDGEGPVASLAFLYEATWDARLLPQIETYVSVLLNSQTGEDHELGPGAFTGWAGYAPWLPRYIHLSRDPAAMKSLERWCDYTAANAFYGSGGAMWHDLAEGYRLFGKREYLEKGVAEMKLMLSDQFLEPGHFYDGFFTPALTLNGGYFSQRMPRFLAALSLTEEKIRPEYGLSYYAPGMIRMWVNPKTHYASERYYRKWNGLPLAVVRKAADREFRFTLKGELSPGHAWVTRAEDGVQVSRTGLQAETTSIRVPVDGHTGEYVLWISTSHGRPWVEFPVSNLEQEVFAPDLLISRRMQAMFFRTLPDANEAVISVAFGYDAGQPMVLKSDGSEVARLADGNMARARWGDLTFPVTPDLRGELLHLIHGRNHDEINFHLKQGIIPWLSLTPEYYFVPQVKLDPRAVATP